jgi:hypothetical protein
MFDISIDWMWMGVGFIVGIGCSWFVCDLVFPVSKRYTEDD